MYVCECVCVCVCLWLRLHVLKDSPHGASPKGRPCQVPRGLVRDLAQIHHTRALSTHTRTPHETRPLIGQFPQPITGGLSSLTVARMNLVQKSHVLACRAGRVSERDVEMRHRFTDVSRGHVQRLCVTEGVSGVRGDRDVVVTDDGDVIRVRDLSHHLI